MQPQTSLTIFFNSYEAPSRSAIWNNVAQYKMVVGIGKRWTIGNDKKLNLCEDTWLMETPLSNKVCFSPFISMCKARFGTKVLDYQRDNHWVNLSSIDPSLNPIMVLLNSILVDPFLEDKIIWVGNSSSIYSVASIVLLLSHSLEPSPCQSKAWICGLIPKINIIFWIFLQNKILTTDNLCKRCFHLPNRCYLSHNEEDNVNHIAIHCPFSHFIWSQILQLWNVN